MSVTIYRDHAHDLARIYRTTLLARSLPGMEGYRKAVAYYRGVVQAFRQNCARR